jgi:predicted Zn finger-like uncharacterized protein
MSMVTRCPACGTGFRVGPEQLKAQHGKVRCGRCATVFNAFDTLSTLPEALPPPEHAAAPASVAAEVPPSGAPQEPPHEAAAAKAERALAAPEPRPVPGEHPRAAPRVALPPAIPAPRRRSGAWAAGSLVLMLTLAAQLIYLFRSELAEARPQLRPWLEQACAELGCSVPYPSNIQHWSIESSDLQSDPGQAARMTLIAVLRNRASFTQSYPALELTLTDTQDRAVARRVLVAQDYLPPGSRTGSGLGPNAEVTLRLAMDTGNLNAAGYRLYLFYP